MLPRCDDCCDAHSVRSPWFHFFILVAAISTVRIGWNTLKPAILTFACCWHYTGNNEVMTLKASFPVSKFTKYYRSPPGIMSRRMLYLTPPQAPGKDDNKAQRIEKSRLSVLSYRILAQSKAVLTKFPYRTSGVLNWTHRSQTILKYALHNLPIRNIVCMLLVRAALQGDPGLQRHSTLSAGVHSVRCAFSCVRRSSIVIHWLTCRM